MMLRFFVSIAGGSMIALLIFWFMVGLITQPQSAQQPDQTVTAFEMLQAPPPPQKKPPPEPTPSPQQPTTQPTTDVMAINPTQPTALQELQMPALDLAPAGLDINAIQGTWSAPLGGDASGLMNPAQGFIEITPLSSRRPNIPDLAWKNKINGWVVIAFTLGGNGHPRNVRVLDSNPRGIFEDSVVSAVSNWIYDPDLANSKSKIVITQKIELFWKDFPENDPYR